MNTTKILLIISIILFVVLVVLLLTGVIPGLKFTTGKPATLEVWGVVDDSDVFLPIIQKFQERYPNVQIIYKKKAYQNYEDELLRAFAAGKGPDIFMVNNKWVPKLKYLMDTAPVNVLTADEFRKRFVDVAIKDFSYDKLIYGVPLYTDTLALFYNVSIFNNAGIINPPETWKEFSDDVRAITQKKGNQIVISGTALGGGKNVVRSQDILFLLMLQNGVDIANREGKIILSPFNKAIDALDFYARFADPDNEFYSWSKDFISNSVDMFAEGRVGMIFGYSSLRRVLEQKNPRLRFEVSYIPQKEDALYKKNYADYFGFSVYTNSKNKFYAWKFLKFLSEPENIYIYVTARKLPSADKLILTQQQKDKDMKIFADQALTADSWMMLDDKKITKEFINFLDIYSPTNSNAQLVLKNLIDKINQKILKEK